MSDPIPATATALDEKTLQAMEARAKAATVAPWTLARNGTEVMALGAEVPLVVVDTQFFYGEITDRMRQDASFIANARQDVPLLIAEVRRLQELEIHP